MNNFTKLPKWAQEYINKTEMQRNAAVSALNEFVNEQTPSKIWIETHPCTGESSGPSQKRRYLQGREVTFKIGKEEVTVGFCFDRDSLKITSGWKTLCFKAQASNVIEIIEEKR